MRNLIIIIFFLLFQQNGFAHSSDSIETEQLELRDSIVNYAQNFLGTPYKWGGTTNNGFDCTGFVYYVFKKFGIKYTAQKISRF